MKSPEPSNDVPPTNAVIDFCQWKVTTWQKLFSEQSKPSPDSGREGSLPSQGHCGMAGKPHFFGGHARCHPNWSTFESERGITNDWGGATGISQACPRLAGTNGYPYNQVLL